jgi:hypothetical protein
MDGQEHLPDETEAAQGSGAPIAPETGGANPAQPATARQLKQTEIRIEERMSGFERSMIHLTRAGVIIGIITGLIFAGQLYEMISGGTQTDKLVDYAKTQAQSADDIAQASDDFTDSAYWMEEHMQDTANAIQDSVDTADRNTKKTISDTETAFRAEQRAWVGVQGTGEIKGFTESETWKVTVVFFNSGRTPARNVRTSGMYVTSPIPLSGPSTENIKQLGFRPAQSIAPQGFYHHNIGAEAAAEGTTAAQLQGQQQLISEYKFIKDKRLFLYYFGILKYDDVFGNPRETQYCIYLANPDTKEVGMCDAFNDLT